MTLSMTSASRLTNRVQLTTVGHQAYVVAVEDAFGADVDFAQPIKIYCKAGQTKEDHRRYSPAECTGAEKCARIGDPDKKKHISTGYVECANLTMRTGMRRFTRQTNGFSKKVENHMYGSACISCNTISALSTPARVLRQQWNAS